MFENINDGDLITLKLASGEEVVCTLESHGAKQEAPINIARDKITAAAHVNDKIEGEYKKVFSKIKTVDKPKIIV